MLHWLLCVLTILHHPGKGRYAVGACPGHNHCRLHPPMALPLPLE